MKDKILFVTNGGEKCDDGLAYAFELAKTLSTGIEALIITPSSLTTQFENIMAAAAFAEAGDMKSMKEVMESEQCACRDLLEQKISEIMKSSTEYSVELLCHISDGDLASAIKTFLKNRKDIDMILLSPSLSESRKSVDIRKLLKSISKPIVHISRHASAEI